MQSFQERGVFWEEGGEAFDCLEGIWADMMFHAFHVVVDGVVVQIEELEEVGEQLVSARDVPGEGFTGSGQGEAAILLVFQQTIGVEALDHVGDAGLRDVEARCDVDHACVALGVDEFEDLFEIVLHCG